jgi:hypothetical protein
MLWQQTFPLWNAISPCLSSCRMPSRNLRHSESSNSRVPPAGRRICIFFAESVSMSSAMNLQTSGVGGGADLVARSIAQTRKEGDKLPPGWRGGLVLEYNRVQLTEARHLERNLSGPERKVDNCSFRPTLVSLLIRRFAIVSTWHMLVSLGMVNWCRLSIQDGTQPVPRYRQSLHTRQRHRKQFAREMFRAHLIPVTWRGSTPSRA